MIVFCFDSWQATDFLKEVITNIYNSFVLAEIFTNFWNYFVFVCKSVIHHSIYISWLDSDHSIAKYLDSLHSNNNLSKHSLCSDCHKKEIIYHRRRHCNLVQSYIFVFISRSEMHFFFQNVKENNTTNAVFSKISKNVKVNWNDQFLWWRVQVLKCSKMTNHVLSLEWQWIFQYLWSWLQFRMIHIKKEKRWWRKYIKDLWDRQIENDNKCIEICIFDYCDSVIVFLLRIIH